MISPQSPLYSPRLVPFLREDADEEVSLLHGFEGGGDDAVGAGGQLVTAAHLTHVDEGGRLGN